MDEFDDVQDGNPIYLSNRIEQLQLQRLEEQQRHAFEKKELEFLKQRKYFLQRDANIKTIVENLTKVRKHIHNTPGINRFLLIFDDKSVAKDISKLSYSEIGEVRDGIKTLMDNTQNFTLPLDKVDQQLASRMHHILSRHLKGGSRRRKPFFLSPKSLRRHRAFYRTKKVRREPTKR
jgi:hypothetical protein